MATQRRTLPALLAGLLVLGVAVPGHTADARRPLAPLHARTTGNTGPSAPLPAALPSSTTTSVATLPGGSRTYQLSLKQLGALYPLNLRGIEGNSGVPFSIRNDEIVTGAKLKLNYAYSPSLIPELSQINVLVNEEVAASIPLPKDQAGLNLTREIVIPPRLITEFNRLNLQLIGHYTMECEDPAHSSLWANISNNSVLELTVASVSLENDLALLPQPFFDRRDVRRLNLPFVFANAPDNGTLEAAGTLSSWFGAQAGYRGATFPASVNQIPERGNAIVMVSGNNRVAGLNVPPPTGPSVSVIPNPNDPVGKLLLVMGRDTKELKIAATTLSVGATTLSGQSATISELTNLKARVPYDAPNWLPNNRPVSFGELAEAQSLSVSGYSPDLIRINFRIPPDLFAWRQKEIPVNLKYRYTPRPNPDKSTLNINVNQQFLAALPLLAVDRSGSKVDQLLAKVMPDGTAASQEQVQIPLFKLPSQTQLQFHYYYDLIKQGACKDVILDNVRGTIEPDSTIDISGFSHFLAMPDLAAFSNAGFPFTRMADLSETAVVLPDSPAPVDYSVYLTLMGKMGDSTGYPATGITVSQAAQLSELSRKDLLVIGATTNQPLIKQWANEMPILLDGNNKQFKVSDLLSTMLNWWDSVFGNNERPARTQLAFSSNSTDALITGFESPLSGNRSVVVISSNRPAGMADAVEALLDAEMVKKIQGSATIIRGKQVDTLLSEPSYYVGNLNPFVYSQWFLSRHPLLLMMIGLGSALLFAIILFLTLRARARRRLS
jgi:hypothetical protein